MPDCDTAGHVIIATSYAVVSAGLAVTAFALAYVARQLRTWRAWTKDD